MASCRWQNFGIVSNSMLNENSFSRLTNSPYFKINWMILWRCISPPMISKTLGHSFFLAIPITLCAAIFW